MTIGEFAADMRSRLPYAPNAQQQGVIEALSRFCAPAPGGDVFILNGYAGTGKTSLTGALVKALLGAGRPVVLMAPTGRAAKVLSAQAGMPAWTIHRKIYRGGGGDWTGGYRALAHNTLDGAVYIVDEASMIPDGDVGGDGGKAGAAPPPEGSLLHDLLEYVFTADGSRLLLLGDVAQLPPVGADRSPALDPAVYKRLGLRVGRAMLTLTARQGRGSGILLNATWLRRAMLANPLPRPRIFIPSEPGDVALTDAADIADTVGTLYRRDGLDQTILVTRSNYRAREFNLGIRRLILDYDEELLKGERLLVAKNNYTWGTRTPGLDFIANGDTGIVTAIRSTEQVGGFRFADITLHLPYHPPAGVDVECKIMLDTLTADGASLPPGDVAALAQARMADPDANAPGDTYETRLRRLRRDPYFNALQVKYAYAVTCHKAQGAQWRNVVVDLGGIAPEGQGLEFYRWLYTAVSRATERLYFLGGEEFAEPPQ